MHSAWSVSGPTGGGALDEPEGRSTVLVLRTRSLGALQRSSGPRRTITGAMRKRPKVGDDMLQWLWLLGVRIGPLSRLGILPQVTDGRRART